MPVPFGFFSWNTFNMFKPIQFIVNYDSQKFSVINSLDTGSIYMDDKTTFFFTLGSEYHKLCFIVISG